MIFLPTVASVLFLLRLPKLLTALGGLVLVFGNLLTAAVILGAFGIFH
jgi:hypothetical protein